MKNIFFTLSFILFALAANAGNEQIKDIFNSKQLSLPRPHPSLVTSDNCKCISRIVQLFNG